MEVMRISRGGWCSSLPLFYVGRSAQEAVLTPRVASVSRTRGKGYDAVVLSYNGQVRASPDPMRDHQETQSERPEVVWDSVRWPGPSVGYDDQLWGSGFLFCSSP